MHLSIKWKSKNKLSAQNAKEGMAKQIKRKETTKKVKINEVGNRKTVDLINKFKSFFLKKHYKTDKP